ncbi:hypothetical protein KKA20_01525 [Patescibacteria group bacterium]|nr:hypothetical protein [Patescibacteria group bacterium]
MGCINKEDLKKYGERAMGFTDKDRFGDEIRRHAEECEPCRKQIDELRWQEKRIKMLQAKVKTENAIRAQVEKSRYLQSDRMV